MHVCIVCDYVCVYSVCECVYIYGMSLGNMKLKGWLWISVIMRVWVIMSMQANDVIMCWLSSAILSCRLRCVWNSKAVKIIKLKYIVNFVANAWANSNTLSILQGQNQILCQLWNSKADKIIKLIVNFIANV